jgi:hypothetical protein
LAATVNTGVDAGGGLLIDWLLVNDKMWPYVDPSSYRVHLPDRAATSDHRLVTAALDFTGVSGGRIDAAWRIGHDPGD